MTNQAATSPAPTSSRYVRFQAAEPNERGHFTGVFGLINNLARAGLLTPEQEAFRRAHNDWYDAAYTDPSTMDPTVYDNSVNPGATAWFKTTATHLLERVPGYLAILTAHGIACNTLHSSAPGRVVYEDEVQIVVVAFTPPH